MYSKTLAVAALLSLSAADIAAVISDIQGKVEGLDSQVKGFSSGQQLAGALGIQQSYGPLSEAVNGAAGQIPSSVSSDDASSLVKQLGGLVGAISSLLGDLADKADDFKAVGASTIVQGDITGLIKPAEEIASKAIAAVPSDDCEVLSSATGIVSSLAAAFSQGAGAYGADGGNFATVPACAGGSDSGSKSSAAAGSSAPAASSAAGSAPAAESSAPAGSAPAAGNGTAVVTSTAVETVCTHPTCTGGVAPANGAASAMGFGAAIAGAVAMLI